MAKVAGPSSEQLLELLKRAADELKGTREDAARVQKELIAERKRREEAEASSAQERTVGGQHPQVRQQLEELQALYQQTTVTLEQTRGELQNSRGDLVNEVAAQREIKSALERETHAHSQSRTALEAEKAAHMKSRAEHEEELQRAEVGAEQQLALVREAAQQARETLEECQGELANEQQRVAEHTESLATALAERDTALTRIEAMEAARKTDRQLEDAKLQNLEDKHALQSARDQQQVIEATAALQLEKDKHQAMAQKFLSEKQKTRELEAALEEAKARVVELESATMAAAEQHAKELIEREEALAAAEEQWDLQRVALEKQLAPLQLQVEVSGQERSYVERKYEELSRELQLTLEQRDEVRRLLDNVQAERARLERALQQR